MVVPGFSERLELAIGSESINSFAKKAGLGESLIRNYIKKGTTPGLDKVIAIAEAAEVSLDWLVLGKGSMRTITAPIVQNRLPSGMPDIKPPTVPKMELPKLPDIKPPSSIPTIADARRAILRQLSRLAQIEEPTVEETQQILNLTEALRALRED
jgi:transcriptional regulator with XRE-family HTH domain